MLQGSLLKLWMDENMSQQSKTISDDDELMITQLFSDFLSSLLMTKDSGKTGAS